MLGSASSLLGQDCSASLAASFAPGTALASGKLVVVFTCLRHSAADAAVLGAKRATVAHTSTASPPAAFFVCLEQCSASLPAACPRLCLVPVRARPVTHLTTWSAYESRRAGLPAALEVPQRGERPCLPKRDQGRQGAAEVCAFCAACSCLARPVRPACSSTSDSVRSCMSGCSHGVRVAHLRLHVDISV